MKMLLCSAVVGVALLAGCKSAHHDDETKVGLTDVPAVVMSGFKSAYPGATVKKVEKEVYPDGKVHYEIEFVASDGKEHEVEVDAAGKVLGDH